MNSAKDYDQLSTLVFVVGLFEGLLPFAGRLLGFSPLLSLPLRLDAPWWWIVAGVVLVGAAAALIALDEGKKRLGAS